MTNLESDKTCAHLSYDVRRAAPLPKGRTLAELFHYQFGLPMPASNTGVGCIWRANLSSTNWAGLWA